MAREISAGGVVVRHMQGRWHLAAIEPEGRAARGTSRQLILALPKGLVDRGETSEQAATREIREETGVEASLITKLGDIKYIYVRSWGDGARVFKIVSFFLLLYSSGELDDIAPEMRKEVRSAVWLPLDEAPRRLAYRGERDMAVRAQEYLNSHPEIEQESDARSRTR
jgi:8-oxo-dGTP pyrophosphatase MutT (NUDIX family)